MERDIWTVGTFPVLVLGLLSVRGDIQSKLTSLFKAVNWTRDGLLVADQVRSFPSSSTCCDDLLIGVMFVVDQFIELFEGLVRSLEGAAVLPVSRCVPVDDLKRYCIPYDVCRPLCLS